METTIKDEALALQQRVTQLEQRLAEQGKELQQFKALVEHETDCIGVINFDGTISYANPSFCQYSEANGGTVGKSITDIVAPEDSERLLTIIHNVHDNIEWHGLISYQDKYGHMFQGLESDFPICDDDGNPQAMGRIIHPIGSKEITNAIQVRHELEVRNKEIERLNAELKQRVTELHQSRSLMQDLIDNLPSAVFVKNENGEVILANRQIEKLLQVPAGEMIGKTAYDLVPPELAAQVWESERQTMLTGVPTQVEEDIPTADGICPHLAVKFPICNNHDEPYAVGGILTDISEQKRVQQELRDSEEQFRLVADFTYDWEYWFSTDGQFLYMSPACERITGYSVEEFIANPQLLIDITNPEDQDILDKHIQSKNHKYEVGTIDFRIITRQGEERWIGHMCQPVYNSTGEWIGIRASNRDITEQKQTEQQLHSAKAESLALQNQIIEAQHAAIRELSTPLIPLSENIVAMPLIGTIDSARAQQVMETILEGIDRFQAEFAILDITGVSVVDTQVANVLIQAAQSVKLLGATVIITGIRPDVAQTLVHLGTDLRGIVTLNSLQRGIAYAMNTK